VAIFSDSVSSVDTELNDVNSSTDSNEEKKSDNSSTNEENNQEATVEKEVSTSNDTETIEQNETDMVTPGQDTAEPHTDTEFITELGSGWYEAPGIGTFYDAGNGWIYEANMGWSFLKVCPTNCSAWLFNENLGWLWFSADLPNMVFSNNAGVSSWIFFPENTLGESLLIFDYTQTAWMQWK
jgi:hypothetical protein